MDGMKAIFQPIQKIPSTLQRQKGKNTLSPYDTTTPPIGNLVQENLRARVSAPSISHKPIEFGDGVKHRVISQPIPAPFSKYILMYDHNIDMFTRSRDPRFVGYLRCFYGLRNEHLHNGGDWKSKWALGARLRIVDNQVRVFARRDIKAGETWPFLMRADDDVQILTLSLIHI